jgi:hypothetical protein
MKESKIFYINSRYRISGTHSDMNYRLDMHDIQPDHVIVLQANIPKSYYMVQEGLNTFILTEGGSSIEISIPVGNYNRTNFKTTIQTLLNTNSPNTWNYIITIPSSTVADTGKYTFMVSGNSGIQPSLTFNNNNISELIGFETNTTYNMINDLLISANVIKMQKEDTLFIRTNIVNVHSNGVLQEINAINSADFDNIVYTNTNSDHYAKEINGHTNNIFNFKLTNENGDIIDLNGQNYTFTICAFKQDNTTDMIKQYIKYKLAGNK